MGFLNLFGMATDMEASMEAGPVPTMTWWSRCASADGSRTAVERRFA